MQLYVTVIFRCNETSNKALLNGLTSPSLKDTYISQTHWVTPDNNLALWFGYKHTHYCRLLSIDRRSFNLTHSFVSRQLHYFSLLPYSVNRTSKIWTRIVLKGRILFSSVGTRLRFSDNAGCVSKTRSRNTRKLHNGGIINPLFDGFNLINACAHILLIAGIFSHPSPELGKYYAKYRRVLYAKPSNRVYTSSLHCE